MSREAKQKKISRRRERDFREKKATKAYLAPKSSPDERQPRVFGMLHYAITWEAIEEDEPELTKVKKEIGEDRWEEIGEQMYDDPAKLVPVIESLLERYPNVPTLYNWLSAGYQAANQYAKVKALIYLNFERNPDYLFAKTAMCELLLRDDKFEEVTRILDKKFDLKLMYPHRDLFHISELLGLQHLLVNYFIKLGNKEQARIQFGIMEKFAPGHPMTEDASSVLTRATFSIPSFLRGWRKQT